MEGEEEEGAKVQRRLGEGSVGQSHCFLYINCQGSRLFGGIMSTTLYEYPLGFPPIFFQKKDRDERNGL